MPGQCAWGHDPDRAQGSTPASACPPPAGCSAAN